MNFADFGMDTASLAGPLERRLEVIRAAGFQQVMISAADIVGHPQGSAGGARAVRASGLRVTGFEMLRDFEGLDGQLHTYKIDVAKSMLALCRRPAARRGSCPHRLLVCRCPCRGRLGTRRRTVR